MQADKRELFKIYEKLLLVYKNSNLIIILLWQQLGLQLSCSQYKYIETKNIEHSKSYESPSN